MSLIFLQSLLVTSSSKVIYNVSLLKATYYEAIPFLFKINEKNPCILLISKFYIAFSVLKQKPTLHTTNWPSSQELVIRQVTPACFFPQPQSISGFDHLHRLPSQRDF